VSTEGIEAVFVETHNWGKAAKFFQGLGFRLEFETGHSSGQLRNGDGPYVFVAEVPPDQDVSLQLVLKVADEAAFRAGPGVEVVTSWEDTHYGTREMIVRDPDGRLWSLQAPIGPGRER
jgi:uncharacterized glyoxalase superfamily protein PhnB